MSTHGQTARRAYETWHEGLPFAERLDTPWCRMLQEHLEPARDLAGRTVLEVGCGRGELSWWLATRPEPPRRVIAGDLALTAVRKGYSRGGHRPGSRASEAQPPPRDAAIRWQVVDIAELSLPDASCDTVISCETVEHVPSPGRAVRELARVLRPGGRLFLTTPNYLNAVGLYRGYRRLVNRPYREVDQPINRFMTIPRTVWTLRRAGLRIVRVDGLGHPLPLPGAALEMGFLARLGAVGCWLAVQSLVVAEKPAAGPVPPAGEGR